MQIMYTSKGILLLLYTGIRNDGLHELNLGNGQFINSTKKKKKSLYGFGKKHLQIIATLKM